MTKADQPLRFRWEQSLRDDPEVTGTALAVLLTMATFANIDGTSIRVTQDTLAGLVGVGDRCIRQHLARAIAQGWLDRTMRGNGSSTGHGTASRYALAIPNRNTGSTGTTEPVESPTGIHVPINRNSGSDQPEPTFPLPEQDQIKSSSSGGLDMAVLTDQERQALRGIANCAWTDQELDDTYRVAQGLPGTFNPLDIAAYALAKANQNPGGYLGRIKEAELSRIATVGARALKDDSAPKSVTPKCPHGKRNGNKWTVTGHSLGNCGPCEEANLREWVA